MILKFVEFILAVLILAQGKNNYIPLGKRIDLVVLIAILKCCFLFSDKNEYFLLYFLG